LAEPLEAAAVSGVEEFIPVIAIHPTMIAEAENR
jgi:hypothetical protein